MRFPVSFTVPFAVAALLVCANPGLVAQESSSSQSQQPQQAPTRPLPSPTYIAVDPLAGVRYDNRFDLSLEMAYQHIKAGPNVLQGANLGGLNLSASYWLTRHWGIQGTERSFFGTSGAAPNTFVNSSGQTENIQGPFIAEYVFVAGPEFLGPHNKHGDIILHVLGGGVYGEFEKDLRGQPPSLVDFYNNQVAPALVMGGHIDLNRSAHWVLRMTPDALLTDYGINYGKKNKQIDINAGFSVGIEYKFKRTR
jgi:hypothetical protein